MTQTKRVIIVGGGFAGLNAAKTLGGRRDIDVLLIDRRNHHLFQPLLYQVAMAGLSPAEIAAPIRAVLAEYRNVSVITGEVTGVNPKTKTVLGDFGERAYDYLILACGANHSYFGNEDWEEHAPGLKTLPQATEIRRRVLTAFENAEREADHTKRRADLTFVVVGGGPTGVELAGAIGEMSRYTLAKDFRNVDPKLTRIILIEAGPRILPMFDDKLTAKATRDLEKLGVQVWTGGRVTHIDAEGVRVGDERIASSTVLWAAGVQAGKLGQDLPAETDRMGRVHVNDDCSLANHAEVFVIGDQAHFDRGDGKTLPGMAPVAVQQGVYVAKTILSDQKGEQRQPFKYLDKGQMATIGRGRAILESGPIRLTGVVAWIGWLLVHIYYLTGFKNRIFVILQWAWSFISFKRGARLIVNKEWRAFAKKDPEPQSKEAEGVA